jgi:hypothetical protein
MKKMPTNHVFYAISFLYPDYPDMIQDLKKRKKTKVTTKRSKILKIKSRSTPSQASEKIPVYSDLLKYVILPRYHYVNFCYF